MSSAATLPARPPGAPRPQRPDTAFELGWDFAHHGEVPPAQHLQPFSRVRQGWEAGRACFGARTLPADRFVRDWLQLRLQAWIRGQAVETTQVNPAFLRRIDVAACPVTQEVLRHGSGTLADAVVSRLFEQAAFAAGNLAVTSARAARAKGSCGVDDALAFARQIAAGQHSQIGGLGADEWSRIAVLASFATPMAHAKAARLPLLVLPPPRLRLLNPVQALQVLLSLQFTAAGHPRRGAGLAELMPSADARFAFHSFLHTLLARRLAAGRLADATAERHAVQALWRDPLVQERWLRLALRLTADECEQLVQTAADRGWAGSGLRWLPAATATDGWALESAGRALATIPPARPVSAGDRAPTRRRIDPAALARSRDLSAAAASARFS